MDNMKQPSKHLVLDFVNVPIENLNLNSYESISQLLFKGLENLGLKPLFECKKIFEPQGVTMLYSIDHGHLTIHTWPESQSCAIDFYHYQHEEKSWYEIHKMEEYLCDALGWDNVSSTLLLVRNKVSRIQTKDCPKPSSEYNHIHQNVKFIKRIKTDYQDLRILDTSSNGRILTMDGFLVITDNKIYGKYTKDITDMILNKEENYEKVLIIGGGDLQIANYIIQFYPNVKQLVLCEIDEKLIEAVQENFKFAKNFQESITNGSFSIQISDPLVFIQSQINQKVQFDRIIIDYNRFPFNESCIAKFASQQYLSLFSKILKSGGYFSQQLNDMDMEELQNNLTVTGFNSIQIQQTKEILVQIPVEQIIGCAQKK